MSGIKNVLFGQKPGVTSQPWNTTQTGTSGGATTTTGGQNLQQTDRKSVV